MWSRNGQLKANLQIFTLYRKNLKSLQKEQIILMYIKKENLAGVKHFLQ